MRENKNRNLAIWILSTIIVILAIILIYFFVVQPQFNNFVNQKRLEGIDYYVQSYMIPQLQANNYVQIPVGNQTLILVPYVPQPLEQPEE